MERQAPARAGLARRRVLGLVAAGGGLLLAPAGLAAAPAAPAGSLVFDVFRKGGRIGFHRIDFTPERGGLSVDVLIELQVKIAFVTAYRYRQEGHDRWRDGVLTATRVATDDNGEVSTLSAEARGERLLVAGPRGEVGVPLGTMTDLCFWNDGILRSPHLLDAQTGELAALDAAGAARETIEVRGRRVETSRHAVSAAGGRTGTIWYDTAGRWVQAVITTRGETLDYRLA